MADRRTTKNLNFEHCYCEDGEKNPPKQDNILHNDTALSLEIMHLSRQYTGTIKIKVTG